MSACDHCLRRGQTLQLLGGHLETERARIDELLACSEDALLDAVAGQRAGELRRALERFDAEEQRARVTAAGLDVVCRCSIDYPAQLRGLRAPPAALYLAGAPRRLAALAAEPAVAIVGARRASTYGIETARSLASELAGAGVTVVSGMALGIDGAAHGGALQAAGAPVGGAATATPTVAVLAGGADRPYPASYGRLYTRIRDAGVVVSELPPGVRPRRWMFPARNRIIAALSRDHDRDSGAVTIRRAGDGSPCGAAWSSGRRGARSRHVAAVARTPRTDPWRG